ncbi:hypothetical protein FIBSPDRAFT_869281, partial [Athelia psychrophila]
MTSYNQHHRTSWSSAQFRMTSTIDFPQTANKSTMSLAPARHATALEVCDVLYGPSPSPPDLEAIERYYEAGATYENPFVTATSRSLIADIHAFARALATVDVPTPRAALAVLFPFLGGADGRWFRGMRVWSEIGNVCESESFGESSAASSQGRGLNIQVLSRACELCFPRDLARSTTPMPSA